MYNQSDQGWSVPNGQAPRQQQPAFQPPSRPSQPFQRRSFEQPRQTNDQQRPNIATNHSIRPAHAFPSNSQQLPLQSQFGSHPQLSQYSTTDQYIPPASVQQNYYQQQNTFNNHAPLQQLQPQPWNQQISSSIPANPPITQQFFNMNDPTTQIGLQLGNKVFSQGQEMVNENLNRYINIPHLKYYFKVSNGYVFNKLRLLLFPFRQKQWTRLVNRSEHSGQMEGYKVPRDDINAPDIYIPSMLFITYVLLYAVILGAEKQFKPEILGLTATTAFFAVFVEVLLLKFGCYLLNVQGDIPFLDLISYCSYQFFGLILTLIAKLVSGKNMTVVYCVFSYTMLSFGFFTVRTLRYLVLPESTGTVVAPMRKRRVHFLFILVSIEILITWFLL